MRLSTPTRRSSASAQAGFSLVELMISLLILAILMTAILTLFESSAQVASTQLAQADLQQAVRGALHDVVRQTRLLGRGGLMAARERNTGSAPDATSDTAWLDTWCKNASCPDTAAPVALALRVDNDFPPNASVLRGDTGSPEVAPGTDVLVVRGVFSSQVYMVRYTDRNSFGITGDTGFVLIEDQTPIGGVSQDLAFFERLRTEGRPEALLLVSPFDDTVFGVAQFDPGNSGPQGTNAYRVAFTISDSSPHAALYKKASADGVFPRSVLSTSLVGSIGVLEEYRYYVRQGPPAGAPAVPGLEERLTLARSRVYPGTELAYPDTVSRDDIDLADDVLDFQVALGFDDSGDGAYSETPDGDGDEWLGNHTNDTRDDWRDWTGALGVVRLTIVARSRIPHRNHLSPIINNIEDHAYGPDLNELEERLYLRYSLQTVVDMRNL